MIPIEKVKLIAKNYEMLEKELASGNIDKKDFVKKSKEYSSIGEIVTEANQYIKFEKEKKDLEKIIEDKDGDEEMTKLAEKELIDLIEKRSNIYSKALFEIKCDNQTKNEIVKKILEIYETNKIKN